MEVLIFFVLLGLIPAAIASNKGRSFALWWLYGASLFIVALPMALLMKPKQVATPKEGSRDITAKARPDNYVPGWLVLVVFVALGGFISFMANGGSSESSASSSSAVASADAGTPKVPVARFRRQEIIRPKRPQRKAHMVRSGYTTCQQTQCQVRRTQRL